MRSTCLADAILLDLLSLMIFDEEYNCENFSCAYTVSCSGQGPLTRSCEYDSEISGSTEHGEFFDYLSCYYSRLPLVLQRSLISYLVTVH
jgi:hypothetical protein